MGVSRQLIDEKYLQFIRDHGCIVPKCWARHSHAHHVVSRGAGRNDYLTVPVCPGHDTGPKGVHMLGRKRFQEKYSVDFNEAIVTLMSEYVRVPRG